MNGRQIFGTAVAIAALGLCLPAVGQAQEEDWWQQESPRARQEDNRTTRGGLDPQAWVKVGYDFDVDGEWDAVEYIRARDLPNPRDAKRERPASSSRSRQAGEADTTVVGVLTTGAERQRSESRTIRGTIDSLTTRHYLGIQEPHLFAKVRTQEGRVARIDLGPASQLNSLNLREGEEVTVSGRRGTADAQGVLVAEEVGGREGTVRVERQSDRNLIRVNGTVQDTRTVRYANADTAHLLGLVKDAEGRVLLVDFGPNTGLERAKLQRGVHVTLLGVPGTIQDRRAVMAQYLRSNDQTIQIQRKPPARNR